MRRVVLGVAGLLGILVWIPAIATAASASTKASAHGKGADQAKAKTKSTAKPPHATASARDKGKATRATRNGKPAAPSGSAKDKAKAAKTAKVAVVEVKPPPPPARASGKVAVFLFDGDGGAPLRARVVRLLRARGLKVNTTLRPVDSAEQYREMADTLNLAAFVDGEFSEDGDQASVTVHLRSGVSGLRVASATLAAGRRALPGEVDKSLWPQLGPPLAKVCVEAAKPRKREREPMRIEAGTPLDNPPADAAEPPRANRPL